ncbi:MAG: PAS domain-containing protein, partial [Kiritimatiellia bacterium]
MVVVVCATAGVTFFVDLVLPLGFAGGVPYVLPMVLTFAFRCRAFTWIVALALTGLVITGWWMSIAGAETWIVIGNRVMAVFAVWVTAFGIQLQRSTARALRKEHQRKERLLDRSPALFILLRATGELDFANQGAEELIGWPASALRGEPWVARVVVAEQLAQQEQH